MAFVKGLALGNACTTRNYLVPRAPRPRSLTPCCSTVESESTVETQTQQLFCFDVSVQVEFGGEDAYFVNDRFGFGVADGVGGWREGGINPADYSRQIMEITSDKLKSDAELQTALDLAHSKTRMPGSCTACLVKIDGATGELAALNLGDSGFVILREDAILARSSPQQHFFDCPKQLAAFPEHCEQTDYARDGQSLSFPLQQDDLIIMGTDGLWDNVFDEEVLRFASNRYGRKKTVADLSEGLARLAQRHSLDPKFPSPYTQAALEEGYDVPWYEKLLKAEMVDGKFRWGALRGGKVDDITVIVAKVRLDNFPLAS